MIKDVGMLGRGEINKSFEARSSASGIMCSEGIGIHSKWIVAHFKRVSDFRCLCLDDELQKALLGEWRDWAALNQFPSEPVDEAKGCNNPVEWVSELVRLLRPNATCEVSRLWYVLRKLPIRKLSSSEQVRLTSSL